MAACRRIACFAKRKQIYIFKHHAFYSTSTQLKPETGTNEIVIPYRIERGPTDILKALASTVHKDHTASHYKYEDDPHFIPSNNIGKRAFALAKESGRKAARYFLENYPEVFKCNKSIPHIKAFDPPMIYTEVNVTSVEALKDCINDCQVENSINVYNILKEKGIAVSQEMKQDLLELLCFYNCKQPIGEELYEERFFKLNIKQDKRRVNKWNAKGMAEQLFNEMEKDNRAYSAMIAGASKFYGEERALALYEEMRQKGLPGTKEAYNSLISVCYLFKEGHESRWEFAYQLLHTMNENRLTPDINTMNAVLELLTHCFKWKKSMQLALRVLAEMRKLKIEPSLGSYYYMLLLFCNQNLQNADILYEFMSQIEGKEFEIKHPADIEFSTAIELCMKGTGDKELGYRIHNLLEFKNNSKFLGNSLLESRYL
ncbi:protein PTCD3 homolog, mitochondrial [Caerostris extrusa]|uniref:Small ribosomal subunit protein mS39 n=1 Tax=Caerostris extrusa TaxID=172846 RepID=A0AAV4QXN2_CAEEX|nr:protein PTCD3 homolog, mitochondrial [Caerostris extrusa]